MRLRVVMVINADVFPFATVKHIVYTEFTFYRQIVHKFHPEFKILQEVMPPIDIHCMVPGYVLRTAVRPRSYHPFFNSNMVGTSLNPYRNIGTNKINVPHPPLCALLENPIAL